MEPVGEGITVEVDRAALLAEAVAIAETAPATDATPAPAGDPALDAPAALPVDHGARATEIAPAVRFATAQICKLAAPAWNITAQESDGVGDALALVLAYWMPDDTIEPKYLALASLAGALWTVAAKRQDTDGKWMPLRAPAVTINDVPKQSDALRL